MLELLILTQIASTWLMVGLIWLVQIVHYPLLLLVGDSHFATYHQQHCARIAWIVGPVMSVEMCGALLLLMILPFNIGLFGAFGLLVTAWLSTAFLQVGLHHRLSLAPHDAALKPPLINRLVKTNWIRTFCWSARGLLILTIFGAERVGV